MNNFITTENGDAIGFYSDLTKFNKEQMKEAVDLNDWESVETFINIQKMTDEYTDYDGLLIISENNGMGFTVKKYNKKGE